MTPSAIELGKMRQKDDQDLPLAADKSSEAAVEFVVREAPDHDQFARHAYKYDRPAGKFPEL
ncbi:MAG: hypothetical protein A2X36_11335 [Elusimicrobia bacterium GWA2_69_24]|nr:MAG: hypothetical protein A2X36_11335 [Elusimicrobia bacterium GWA2_69_24]HBL15289.1 hypothetical protein [Elusimicrobiota bacterium]